MTWSIRRRPRAARCPSVEEPPLMTSQTAPVVGDAREDEHEDADHQHHRPPSCDAFLRSRATMRWSAPGVCAAGFPRPDPSGSPPPAIGSVAGRADRVVQRGRVALDVRVRCRDRRRRGDSSATRPRVFSCLVRVVMLVFEGGDLWLVLVLRGLGEIGCICSRTSARRVRTSPSPSLTGFVLRRLFTDVRRSSRLPQTAGLSSPQAVLAAVRHDDRDECHAEATPRPRPDPSHAAKRRPGTPGRPHPSRVVCVTGRHR